MEKMKEAPGGKIYGILHGQCVTKNSISQSI